ncbi:hypothetical protein GA0074695_5987 [Micromonospora viridifaciens]|uniref:Lipoprotein n=1 Tax=Micromonospora viridifaciens TaxID=1881 RepID=A0A1C4ZRR9_MICVI|nr:hypothetical protein [Micromonospora viridifaciens]SCF35471.1 hypothetical protein GA0074695_5987 [Micromonospora viridifaciens]
MRRSLAVLCLPLLVAAGCAQPGSEPVGPVVTPVPGDPRSEAFHLRAAEVADAWRPDETWRSGYVPLQDATVLTGDPGFTEETKVAFSSGWYREQIELPTATPADGAVRFPDGTLRVPLISAAEAYAQLDRGDPPPCDGRPAVPPAGPSVGPSAVLPPAERPVGPSAVPPVGPPGQPGGGPTIEPGPDGWVATHAATPCIPLTVTAVQLGSASVRTSRGVAEVPAWLFTVAELRVPVARLAVASRAVGAVPEGVAPARPVPDGVVTVMSLDAVDGARLDFRVGLGACDTGLTPLVLERDDVVVLGAGVTRSTGPCTQQLVLKPTSVTLKAPLGDRVVLDVGSGAPLRLGQAP